jgi:hypothetical protein
MYIHTHRRLFSRICRCCINKISCTFNDHNVQQGKQMAYFYAKIWQILEGRRIKKMVVYILRSFGILYGHLVYFVAIWYIIWPFGILHIWPFGIGII